MRRCVVRVRGLGIALWCAGAVSAAFGHGDFHDRLIALRAALAARPDDAGLHFDLAWVFCEHGEWQPALDEIQRVEQLAPESFPTDLVRGCALRAAERPAEACAALDRHLAAHPGDVRALIERARARDALGRGDDALTDYRALSAAVPDANPDLVLEIAEALERHGSADEAVRVIDTSTQRIGPFPGLLMFALEIDLSHGRTDAALQRVDALQALAPRPEPWMARRAEILAQAGRVGAARAAWEALLTHLAALPNLERGAPVMQTLAARAREACGELSRLEHEPISAPRDRS